MGGDATNINFQAQTATATSIEDAAVDAGASSGALESSVVGNNAPITIAGDVVNADGSLGTMSGIGNSTVTATALRGLRFHSQCGAGRSGPCQQRGEWRRWQSAGQLDPGGNGDGDNGYDMSNAGDATDDVVTAR